MRRAAQLLFVVALLLAACGDGTAELARFCDANERLAAADFPDLAGVEDQEQLEVRLQEFLASFSEDFAELEDAAPPEVAAAAATAARLVRSAADEGNFAALQGQEFTNAGNAVEAHAAETCPAPT